MLSTQTKTYIAAVAAAIAIFAGVFAWSSFRVRRLEKAVADAKEHSAASERTAETREAEAERYIEKIAYLERQLGETRLKARKQDEQLEKHSKNSSRVRGDVHRARNDRVVPADERDVCLRLERLGHPCD